MSADDVPAGGEQPTLLNFDYEKSPHFRVIYITGAHGGPSAEGMVHVALYNERKPIPKRVVHQVNIAAGTLGPEVSQDIRPGVFREVECLCVISPETAEQLAEWLLEKAGIARSIRTELGR